MKNADAPAMPIELNGFGQYAPTAFGGLTKREMFAMYAMQGLLSANATYNGKTNDRSALAKDAIAFANALLEELSK